MSLVILTGASGSGKTTVAREFSKRCPLLADVFFFDSIGVPSADEMIRQFGSAEEWQHRKTQQWLIEISARRSAKPVLFEGQMRLAFIHAAAEAAGIRDYTVLLFDCDDQTRRQRLILERQQAQLATDEMMNWARYLRDEAGLTGDTIVDTSGRSVQECVEFVRRFLLNQERPIEP
jgi:dephospho-CoA kinase